MVFRRKRGSVNRRIKIQPKFPACLGAAIPRDYRGVGEPWRMFVRQTSRAELFRPHRHDKVWHLIGTRLFLIKDGVPNLDSLPQPHKSEGWNVSKKSPSEKCERPAPEAAY
jgi:hypothetical protein